MVDQVVDLALELIERDSVVDSTKMQRMLSESGQTTPILVYKSSDGPGLTRFRVVDGNVRVAAAQAIGWMTIRAEIQPKPGDSTELLARRLAANAKSGRKATHLATDFKTLRERGLPLVKIGALVGISPAEVSLYIDLLDAPTSVQDRVNSGDISIWGWKFLRDKPREFQEKAAGIEKPSVRALQRLANRFKEAKQLGAEPPDGSEPMASGFNPGNVPASIGAELFVYLRRTRLLLDANGEQLDLTDLNRMQWALGAILDTANRILRERNMTPVLADGPQGQE